MSRMVTVGPAEGGQKLLRYLERSLGCPRADIYRWLRTGQIRVNGGRVKPERLLETGDEIRLPPQAGAADAKAPAEGLRACEMGPEMLGQGLAIVWQNEDILVLDKPSGLPVQGGSGHEDSVAARLKAACPAGCYVPAPAHRLDLHASGLLLCGKTHAEQTRLHGLFRESKAELERGYLCWVKGDAAQIFAERRLLEDFVAPERVPEKRAVGYADGKSAAVWRERMAVVNSSTPGAKPARAYYLCLSTVPDSRLGMVSLMQAWLLTGRKHQIRVQLAARGFPLLGDGRYGGTTGFEFMLHAWQISLPLPGGPLRLKSLPNWPGRFAVPDNILIL